MFPGPLGFGTVLTVKTFLAGRLIDRRRNGHPGGKLASQTYFVFPACFGGLADGLWFLCIEDRVTAIRGTDEDGQVWLQEVDGAGLPGARRVIAGHRNAWDECGHCAARVHITRIDRCRHKRFTSCDEPVLSTRKADLQRVSHIHLIDQVKSIVASPSVVIVAAVPRITFKRELSRDVRTMA